MAGNVKGITIQFQGDTTKLDSALRSINNNTKSLDKELKQVNNALKFNPTSVELWRQKQTLLTQKVNETKQKVDVLKQAQAKMDADGVDKNSEEYRKLQREIIVAENQLKTFEGQLKAIGNVNIRAASEQFKEYGDKLTSAGQAMQGVSMVAAGLVASLGAISVKAGRSADDLNTLSKVTGISTGDLQKYSYAADLVDTSTEAIAKSTKKLTRNAYEAANGSKSQAESFEALGVSVTDADGNLRDSDAIFQDVISALGQMTNETERDALAQKLMGKSAAELNPLIEDGGETYKKVSDTLKKYNLDYIDQETLDKANEFNDELDTMKLIGSVAISQVGSQLAATLAPALEKIVDLFGRFAEWLGNLNPQVLTIIGTIAAVLAVVAPLLMGLGKLSFAISSILSLAATIGPVLVGIISTIGPILILIGLLVAAGVALYKNWDTIKANAIAWWESVKATFEQAKAGIISIWNSVKLFFLQLWASIIQNVAARVNSMKNTLSTAWATIKNTATTWWNNIKTAIVTPIQSARDKVKGIIDKLKSYFPINVGNIFKNIKTPHFSLNWSTKDFGKLGKISYPTGFNISWYKKAMDNPYMFSNPTFFGAGEAGDEILYGRNSLMRDISNAVAKGGGGGDTVTINVYASPGMDVKALAAEVERRLIESQNRRRLAWQ